MSGTIGRIGNRAREFLRSHGISPLRMVLTPQLFDACWPRPTDSRAILIPEVVFWLMATVGLTGGCSMAAAAEHFWMSLRAVLPYLPSKPVTEEAFCMARKAMPVRFFVCVFHAVCQRFEQAFPDRFRWRGLRLLGLDGMKSDLPNHPNLRRAFPPHNGGKGRSRRPFAVLVGLVGLWDGLCRGFRLVPAGTSEQISAHMLARHLRPGDLLLCDKNFPGYHLFCRILSRGAEFLFRLPANRYKDCPRLATPSGRSEEWYVQPDRPKKLRSKGFLPWTLCLRICRYQKRGFRPSLLVTSLLDTQAYPYDELVGLYHERWRQETMHREWKYTLSLCNLRSHHLRGLLKEVLVQLTVNNVARWIMAEASGHPVRPVDLSFLEAKRRIVCTATVMAAAATEALPRLYRTLLAEIGREVILVRPGRSYPRRHDTQPRNKGHGEVALPARVTPSQKEDQDMAA